MSGKNCIAVAVDKRFGSGPQTINVSPRTVLIPHSRVMVGFAGLEGDVQSLLSEISTLVAEKKGRFLGFGFGAGGTNTRCRKISPKSMSMLLSHFLYGRRGSPYYVEPIIAGLEKKRVKENTRITGKKEGTTHYMNNRKYMGDENEEVSFQDCDKIIIRHSIKHAWHFLLKTWSF